MFSFNNCGKKIKITAEVLKWLALVAGLILTIVGIVNMTSNRSAQVAAGTTLLIIGLTLVITSWIGSLCLYGFGVIVEAYEAPVNCASQSTAPVSTPATPAIFKDWSESPAPTSTSGGWRCSRCDTLNPNHLGTCPQCGEVKPAK